MFTPQTKIQPHTGVLTTTLSETEVVLLHTQTSHYYTLNATGSQIWQSLSAQHSLGEISQQLADTYAITEREAEAAVQTLLQELHAEKLVIVL